jgi:hypothetical protein
VVTSPALLIKGRTRQCQPTPCQRPPGGQPAASGASFLLGSANRESATATLKDTRPLSLSAPARKAPLKVNRRTLVKNLYAQYVSGSPRASSLSLAVACTRRLAPIP